MTTTKASERICGVLPSRVRTRIPCQSTGRYTTVGGRRVCLAHAKRDWATQQVVNGVVDFFRAGVR